MSAVSPVRGFIRGFVRRKGQASSVVGALAGAAGQDMSKLLSSRTLSCGGRLPCRTAHARFARGPRAVHFQCDAIHCAGTLCPRRGLLRTHRSRQYRQEPESCSERGASAQPSQRRCTRLDAQTGWSRPEADKGLLPGCDQHLTLGLDGVNLEPTHGQGAAPLKHDPFALKMVSSRRCDEVDLVLHGEDRRVIGKAGEGGVAAGAIGDRASSAGVDIAVATGPPRSCSSFRPVEGMPRTPPALVPPAFNACATSFGNRTQRPGRSPLRPTALGAAMPGSPSCSGEHLADKSAREGVVHIVEQHDDQSETKRSISQPTAAC